MDLVRGHNCGTIYHDRGKGHWYARVTMWDGRRSQPRRAPPWDDTEAGAREVLRDLLAERDAEVVIPRKLTLAGYLQRWLADMEATVRPSTMRAYRRSAAVLAPIGNVKLAELRPSQIERAIAALAATPRTALHAHNVLRAALNDAVEARYLMRSPMVAVRAPRVTVKATTALTASQATTLIKASEPTTYGPLWALLIGTGLRVNEALGLTWGAVDLEAGTIAVTEQLAHRDGEWARVPTKAARTLDRIALPTFAADALREQRRRMLEAFPESVFGGGLVFLTGTGQPVRSDETIRSLRRVCKKLGLPQITQHALRHTSLTLLADAGIPEDSRQRRAGHSTTAMSRRYTSGAEAADRTAADALQTVIGG